MTVPATSRRAGPYNGNGSTTSFSFSFKTFAAGDLQVTKTGTTGLESVLVLNSDYSVALNVDQDASPGGSITYPISGTALASGEKLTIVGDLDYEQTTDLLGGGAFNARTIEDTFDRTVIQIQQLEERADRALTLPVSVSGVSTTLPVPNANKLIGWDANANSLTNIDQQGLFTGIAFSDWVSDTFTGNGTVTSYALSRAPGALANIDVSVSGVTQVATVDYSLVGNVLTFTTAPANGTTVFVRYGSSTPQSLPAYSSELRTATAGQTLFTFTSLSYTPGANNLMVYVNGLRMVGSSDYTETSSTSITFTSGLSSGDEVLVVAGRSISDAVGAENVSFLQAGTGAQTRAVQAKLRDVVSVLDFGADLTGVADSTTAIQNAITAASAAGGGTVYFPSGTYRTNSSITLPSNVYLSGYGATISWGGGASPVITTATTGLTINAGIEGLTINGSTTATKLLELYSTYHCSFRDLTLTSTSTTNIAIDMLVNTSGGTIDGGRNNVFNLFDNILQEGTCGTALRMRGDVTVPTVVTLNTFVNFNCRGGAAVRGIDFAEWVDSNYFAGITRINLPPTATGAVGVEWNSVAPTTNNGVYSNNFDHLAVDTFGVGSGRIGVKMNLTKLNKIGYYFQDPVAEGGDIVVTADTYGYDIVHAIGGTNSTAHKVQYQNYAAGGSYSPSYSIYTNAFTLTGANPASFVAGDSFNTGATGTAAGITLLNQTVAATFTMFSYNAVNVSNIIKGAGSTITNQVGLYFENLTSGTNNYAIISDVSAGTNKWGLYMRGGARNFLGAGGVEVAAGATNMTSGFVHVPSAAGVPTGAPTNPSGNVPLYYDSTNNRLYAYNGSWRSVVLA